MTISTTAAKSRYAGDGSTTSFPTAFKFLDADHVRVVLRAADGSETVWTEGSEYSLTGAGAPGGGTVEVSTDPVDHTPAAGETLVVKLAVPPRQETSLPLGGAFPSTAVEAMADLAALRDQQIEEALSRAPKFKETTALADVAFPEPEAGKPVGWNAAGDALVNLEAIGRWQGDWTTATDYVALDVVRDPSTKNVYVCEVAHISGTFATDLAAGKWSEAINVEDAEAARDAALAAQAAAETAESNAETAQAAAAASAAAAATSATDAGNSATAAAGSASTASAAATAAQTAETNAETAEANAASSASAAATSAANAASSAAAAQTAQTAAETAESSAETAVSDALAIYGSMTAINTAVSDAQAAQSAAETAETNAETAEANAASSASAAATSASDAASSASAAAASASTASSSATTASNAATAAQTAETNAETAEAAAEAAQAAAQTAETNAAAAKTVAEAARDKAADWAEEAEDVPVETGQFSALHHAAKAAASSMAAAGSATSAANSATTASNAATAAQTAETNAETAQAAAEAAQASAEAAAADGIAIVPRGSWQGGTAYSIDDGVTYQGSFWRSLQDGNQSNVPDSSPTHWEQSVAKGDTGATGPAADTVIMLAVSDEDTAIEAGTAKLTFRMPMAFTLSDVRASLKTASGSGAVTIDINENGATILSTKLTIDQGEKTSTTAATPAVISDAALADDAEITVDIDGAGANATGLKVTLIGAPA